MGKTKRLKPSQMATKIPLEQDIQEARFAKSKNRNKIRLRQDEEEQFVNSNLSRKILSAARDQQREMEGAFGPGTAETAQSKIKVTKLDLDDNSDLEDEEEDTLEPDTFYENIVINEEDERSIEMFMSKNSVPRRTLADIIMEKITEKQTELDTQFSDAGSLQLQDLDPRVKQMYEGVKDVLKNYRSGKLPKAFKIIPNLKNWEQILYITGNGMPISSGHDRTYS